MSKSKGRLTCRNTATIVAVLHCKGGPMKDRRAPREGARNEQREWLDESESEGLEESWDQI